MAHTIQNSSLQFSYNPNGCTWDLAGSQTHGPSVEGAQVNVRYHRGLEKPLVLGEQERLRMGTPRMVNSIHGPLRQVELLSGADSNSISFSLTFALPEDQPLLLWKMEVSNRGKRPVYIDRIDLLNAGFVYMPESISVPATAGYHQVYRGARGVVRPAADPGELIFLSNGWQSWSYTGVYGQHDRYHRTRLGPLRLPLENPSTPRPRRAGVLASDMFGVLGDRKHRTGILAGFLSQKVHFGSLEVLMDPYSPALRLWANGDGARLDPGHMLETDWACLCFLHLDSSDPLGPYLEAVARENLHTNPASLRRQGERIPTGWCSWYQFSSDDYLGTIDPQNLQQNLEAMKQLHDRLPLEVLQIDDGYQEQVGDWFSFKPVFSNGVTGLAGEIRQAGLEPGIWLAPFIVHPRSRLAHDHPDWLLRNRLGLPASAGFLWNSFPAALDLTHPEALQYARDVVHKAAHEWGYPYLKLDFLYAAALHGRRRDPTCTRAQALRMGLEAVREAAGDDVFLLGCGCPLGSAIGLVDGMRIGADTAGGWLPSFRNHDFFLRPEVCLPSARNACHNALTRASLHKRWWINDPDCLMLRPDTRLSLAEVQTVATVIALTGGALFLSDHLPALPEERRRIAEALLPLIGKVPYLLDMFDSPTPSRLQLDLDGPAGRWHMLALFNWQDRSRDLELQPNVFYLDPQVVYMARSFWDGRVYRIAQTPLVIQDVPAHGVALLAARPARPYLPQYLGSDLHISQGLELVEWKWDGPARVSQADGRPGKLSFRLQRPGPARGIIDLALHEAPRETLLNETPAAWEAVGEGIYRVRVEFEREVEGVLWF
jgi:alpha-galactosidase